MSDAVLEMYQSLDECDRQEVDNLIQRLVDKHDNKKKPFKRDLSEFIGCISEEDAEIAYAALAECRKIDYGEW